MISKASISAGILDLIWKNSFCYLLSEICIFTVVLRFFRSLNNTVIFVILLIGGLTWIHGSIQMETSIVDKEGMFLYDVLAHWMENIPELAVWSGLILTLAAAFLLIVVNNKLHLIDKVSYLPALCYILLIGGVPVMHRINPVVIATILLIIGFMLLIASFKSEKLSYHYFTVPVFISIASFIYQYMYVYMLVVWFALLFLRPGYWREWVFSVLGFMLPVFFAFSWFFLVEDDYTRMVVFYKDAFSITQAVPELSVSTIIFFLANIVVVVGIFGHLIRYFGSKKIIIRNGYYILIAIAIITLGLSLIVPDTLPLIWYLMAFPLSFFLANYLSTVRSVRWGTVIMALLFTGVVIMQVINLFGN